MPSLPVPTIPYLMAFSMHSRTTVIQLCMPALVGKFNGNWQPWSVTSDNVSQWNAAWAHLADLAHNYQGMKIYTVWNPNYGGFVDYTSAYPGDQYVDVISIDQYGVDQGGTDDSTVFDAGGGSDFTILSGMAMASQHGKAFSYSETGGGTNDATFPNNIASVVASSPAKPPVAFFNMWICDCGGNSSLLWTGNPTTSAAWLNAYKAVSANSGTSTSIASGIVAKPPKIAGGVIGTVTGSNGSTTTFNPGQVTMPTAAPAASNVTFTDNFANLNNWTLIAPDTPNGRGGPNYNEQGDQWWTNPYLSCSIQNFTLTGNGLQLGLEPTPASQQAISIARPVRICSSSALCSPAIPPAISNMARGRSRPQFLQCPARHSRETLRMCK